MPYQMSHLSANNTNSVAIGLGLFVGVAAIAIAIAIAIAWFIFKHRYVRMKHSLRCSQEESNFMSFNCLLIVIVFPSLCYC